MRGRVGVLRYGPPSGGMVRDMHWLPTHSTGKTVGICGFSEPGYYEFTLSYTFSMEAGKRTRVPSVVTAIL